MISPDRRMPTIRTRRRCVKPTHRRRSNQSLQYGIRASSGGGRSSARETIGRVAAGAIAAKWLRVRFGVDNLR